MANDVYSIRFSDEQIARIDAWRELQPEWLTRSEAVRRLVEHGLRITESKSAKDRT